VSVDLSNQIRSVLKTFGLMAGKGAGRAFVLRVRELLDGRPMLAAIIDPLLAAWQAVREQIAVLDRRLIRLAKGDPTCRLLMTCPRVSVLVATSFAANARRLMLAQWGTGGSAAPESLRQALASALRENVPQRLVKGGCDGRLHQRRATRRTARQVRRDPLSDPRFAPAHDRRPSPGLALAA